jgi:hypothetical protein
MPRNGSMKQMQKDSKSAQGRLTATFPKSGRKAPGTRMGMLQDWREGSSKSGKTSVGIGKAVRDGR